jgi:pimeloyl-ACP methyl ester carboxylesterase
MARFVLVPGAGGEAWTWHLLVKELEARGHEAIAVDILEDDPKLGLEEFAQQVLDAVAGDPETVLVALSLGAFTAPVVASRTALRALVLLNPMIPLPGETPGEWWAATGQPEAREAADRAAGRSTEFTLASHFFHDLPDALREDAAKGGRSPSPTPFGQPCEFTEWPPIPLKVIIGRDDRLFPLDFQQRVVADRLNLVPEVMTGGHLLTLSRPAELADRLEAFLAHIQDAEGE